MSRAPRARPRSTARGTALHDLHLALAAHERAEVGLADARIDVALALRHARKVHGLTLAQVSAAAPIPTPAPSLYRIEVAQTWNADTVRRYVLALEAAIAARDTSDA